MFKIVKDFSEGEAQSVSIECEKMPLYGLERAMGIDDTLPEAENLIPFRLYDDDDNLMLSGMLHDDEDAVNQSAVLRYGETYAGCTRIDVRREGEWCTEIG